MDSDNLPAYCGNCVIYNSARLLGPLRLVNREFEECAAALAFRNLCIPITKRGLGLLARICASERHARLVIFLHLMPAEMGKSYKCQYEWAGRRAEHMCWHRDKPITDEVEEWEEEEEEEEEERGKEEEEAVTYIDEWADPMKLGRLILDQMVTLVNLNHLYLHEACIWCCPHDDKWTDVATQIILGGRFSEVRERYMMMHWPYPVSEAVSARIADIAAAEQQSKKLPLLYMYHLPRSCSIN